MPETGRECCVLLREIARPPESCGDGKVVVFGRKAAADGDVVSADAPRACDRRVSARILLRCAADGVAPSSASGRPGLVHVVDRSGGDVVEAEICVDGPELAQLPSNDDDRRDHRLFLRADSSRHCRMISVLTVVAREKVDLHLVDIHGFIGIGGRIPSGAELNLRAERRRERQGDSNCDDAYVHPHPPPAFPPFAPTAPSR